MSSGSGIASNTFAFSLDGDTVHLVLDTTVYRVAAIQKTGYRLARLFTLALGSPDNNRIPVALIAPQGGIADGGHAIVTAFFRELADQELREHVAEQTREIRALLLAQAFSRTDLVNRE